MLKRNILALAAVLLFSVFVTVPAQATKGGIPWGRIFEQQKKDIPLTVAAYSGDMNGVNAAIKNGAHIDGTGEYLFDPYNTWRTALHIAVERGHKKIVKRLLDLGANVNVYDCAEDTPLHYAALNGQKGIVKLLLINGADMNVRNKNKKTPLEVALGKNDQEVANAIREFIQENQPITEMDNKFKSVKRQNNTNNQE